MNTDLRGKTAVVTGGSSGIGRSLCETLAATGMNVVVVGRDPARTQGVAKDIRAKGGNAVAALAHVAEPSEVDAVVALAVEKFGALDVLVNNAGIARGGRLLDSTPDDWNIVMETNVTGTFLFTRAAYRVMKQQQHGHILNIASQAAGWWGAIETIYGTSKTAQVKLTIHTTDEFRSANRENGQDHPTFFCHAVCPGGVDTPWYDGKNVDRSRMLRPEEVAELSLKILEHPEQSREFFETWARNKPYRVSCVDLFRDYPNVIRIWRE